MFRPAKKEPQNKRISFDPDLDASSDTGDYFRPESQPTPSAIIPTESASIALKGIIYDLKDTAKRYQAELVEDANGRKNWIGTKPPDMGLIERINQHKQSLAKHNAAHPEERKATPAYAGWLQKEIEKDTNAVLSLKRDYSNDFSHRIDGAKEEITKLYNAQPAGPEGDAARHKIIQMLKEAMVTKPSMITERALDKALQGGDHTKGGEEQHFERTLNSFVLEAGASWLRDILDEVHLPTKEALKNMKAKHEPVPPPRQDAPNSDFDPDDMKRYVDPDRFRDPDSLESDDELTVNPGQSAPNEHGPHGSEVDTRPDGTAIYVDLLGKDGQVIKAQDAFELPKTNYYETIKAGTRTERKAPTLPPLPPDLASLQRVVDAERERERQAAMQLPEADMPPEDRVRPGPSMSDLLRPQTSHQADPDHHGPLRFARQVVPTAPPMPKGLPFPAPSPDPKPHHPGMGKK